MEEFLAKEVLIPADIDQLTKEKLVAVAQFLGLKISTVAKKTHVDRLVVEALKENGYIEVESEQKPSNQLEVLQLQIKLEQIEKEADQAKVAFELEKMQHEIKMKELEIQAKKSVSSVNFDFAKNIRLVPKFDHKEVAKYFTSFENLAQK